MVESNQKKPAKAFETYKKVSTLGVGSFGTAYLVECQSDKSLAVIKQIDIAQMSEEERRETLNEAKILEVLSHPNIVQTIEFFEDKNTLYLALEYVDGENLSVLSRAANARDEMLPLPVIMRHMIKHARVRAASPPSPSRRNDVAALSSKWKDAFSCAHATSALMSAAAGSAGGTARETSWSVRAAAMASELVSTPSASAPHSSCAPRLQPECERRSTVLSSSIAEARCSRSLASRSTSVAFTRRAYCAAVSRPSIVFTRSPSLPAMARSSSMSCSVLTCAASEHILA